MPPTLVCLQDLQALRIRAMRAGYLLDATA